MCVNSDLALKLLANYDDIDLSMSLLDCGLFMQIHIFENVVEKRMEPRFWKLFYVPNITKHYILDVLYILLYYQSYVQFLKISNKFIKIRSLILLLVK